jgi:uncharacterized membrane protein
MLLDHKIRRRCLFLLGAGLTLSFIILRYIDRYGEPRPRVEYPSALWTFLSFLNCTKYPASGLYLLMTLGPAILALACFDHGRSHHERQEIGGASRLQFLTQPIITFGRVPLFFYLLHIPLIHSGAVLLDYIRFGWSPLANSGPWLPPEAYPKDYGVSLPVVYLIWIGVLLILYLPCRWFAGVKRRRRDVWLSYL